MEKVNAVLCAVVVCSEERIRKIEQLYALMEKVNGVLYAEVVYSGERILKMRSWKR